MKRHILTLLACLALALGAAAFAGCGDDDDEATVGTTPTPASEAGGGGATTAGTPVEVSMKDVKMIPEKVTVKVGQLVKWTNDDPIDHTATAKSGADFDSGNMKSGDTFEWKAEKAGTVEYVCTIHPSQTGTITVTGG
jgi:plastocyanin